MACGQPTTSSSEFEIIEHTEDKDVSQKGRLYTETPL